MRVQLHQLISPGHRGGLDMRKEQMSRNLIHSERPKRSQREPAPVDPTTGLHVCVELQSLVPRTPRPARSSIARCTNNIIAPSGGIVLHPRSY